MNYNKKSIETAIRSLEYSVKMSNDIQETVNQFKHYKNVNAKFTEAIKAKGYCAYICKDRYSIKLHVSCNQHNLSVGERYDFTVYVSNIMNDRSLTWELIEKEIVRYDFHTQLCHMKQRAENFDQELLKWEELYDYVNTSNFTCFETYDIKRKIEDILDHAKKQ
jgi:hypothetical protein